MHKIAMDHIIYINSAEAKTYCHDQSAIKLAVHALQAEKIDDFRIEDYIPPKVIYEAQV